MAPIDLDTLANSRLGLMVAEGVARTLPAAVGTRLASGVAGLLASDPESGIARAVRANQWVASGGTCTGQVLDQRVRAALEHMATCVYQLYRLSGHADALEERVTLTPVAAKWLGRKTSAGPLVLASAHLTNFDLVGRALAARGLRAQVLSVPDPTGAYESQNRMRDRSGLTVTPLSMQTIRDAEKRLRAGGVVVTGIDRPSPEVRHQPRFFGRRAALPVVHVRLAARTGATLLALTTHMRDDGIYEVDCTPVPLPAGSGDSATIRAAEAVLNIAEDAIRAHPEQWAMPHPVWPEAEDELIALERPSRNRA